MTKQAPKVRLLKSDYEALAAFRYALRKFLSFSEEAAKGVGLTPQQHQALLTLKGYPGRDFISIGELAERLQIKHHSAVGLVDRLEEQGLVSRKQSSDDRRSVNIQLTRRGVATIDRMSPTHAEELQLAGKELQVILQKIVRGGSQKSVKAARSRA